MNIRLFLSSLTTEERNTLVNAVKAEIIQQIKNERGDDFMKLTQVRKWIKDNNNSISIRLRNILLNIDDPPGSEFIETITESQFLRTRNAGRITLNEFRRLVWNTLNHELYTP